MSDNPQNRTQAPRSNVATVLGGIVDRARQAFSAGYNIILDRQFNPAMPLQPVTNATERKGGPRAYDYRTGQNINVTPRSEYPQLNDFEELRNICRLYDVASLCRHTRVEEIASLDWTVKAKNKADQQKYEQNGAIDFVTHFFKKPSEIENDFGDWVRKLATDVFEIDAMTIYVKRANDGRLLSLEPVDGATIKPVIDAQGRVLAYQQIIKGLVSSNYIRYGLDKASEVMPIPLDSYLEDEWPQELIYRPKNVRTDSPYGIAAVELVIMRANMALRKQSFDMAYFTDGNTPEMILNPDSDEKLNVDQVDAFETYFNQVMAGNDQARRRTKFLAWKANPVILKPFSYDPALDELMLKLTCAAFDVTPAEIGFTDDVNKASSEGQENVQYRKGIKPLGKWFKQLFDLIIGREFGLDGLEFVWDFGESQDSLQQAQVDQIYIQTGVLQPPEVRSMRFSDEVDQAPQATPSQPVQTQPQPQQAQPKQPQAIAQPDKARQVPKAAQVIKSDVQDVQTGVMIAFMLPMDIALRLAIQNAEWAEAPNDLHVTLAFLGDIPELAYTPDRVIAALKDFASNSQPIVGTVNGYGKFSGEGAVSPLYANFDAPGLPEFRQSLVECLSIYGIDIVDNHGYTPHITLGYLPKDTPIPNLEIPQLALAFNEVVLAWGDKRIPIQLGVKEVANVN